MPGVDRVSIDLLVEAVGTVRELGIPDVALFPATPAEVKTEDGAEACNPHHLMCRAVRAVTQAWPDIGVVHDVALAPTSPHSHDGVPHVAFFHNPPTNKEIQIWNKSFWGREVLVV